MPRRVPAVSAATALAQARQLLAHAPLVDGHNDLPWVIRRDKAAPNDVRAYGLGRTRPGRDTDLPRLQSGLVGAQWWAAFVPTPLGDCLRTALELIELIRRMNAEHSDVLMPAFCADDVARARRAGRIASFLCVENGAALENSLDVLRTFYRLGVRYLTLCHNETIDWVDSATDAPRHGGLTDFGRDVIREMNRLGMLVDLSHTTPAAQLQALDLSTVPVAITHANARALCNHPRNAPDDILARLRENGGIIMATFVPAFVSQAVRDWDRPFEDAYGKMFRRPSAAELTAREHEAGPPPRATLAQVCDHIEYLVTQVGEDHVGIGSDYFGGPAPIGLEHVGCFPYLFAELIRRGWREPALRKLAGGNFLRVLRLVEKGAGEQRGR